MQVMGGVKGLKGLGFPERWGSRSNEELWLWEKPTDYLFFFKYAYLFFSLCSLVS